MRILKLHFTNEWLRKKIESDPDLDCEIGHPYPNEETKMPELSEFQRRLDASVTAEQAAEYVRKERERNANCYKPIPQPDGFINDYD